MRTSTNLPKTDTIVEQWLENKINRIEYDFSCGGDSMNETDLHIFNDENEEIEVQEIKDYFEDQVYRNVEFYECSDGHYMGEFGKVTIQLVGSEDEGYEFEYNKDATSEWEETETDTIEIKLKKEESKFIKEFISNMNGSNWNGEKNINYKKDCIVSDEEDEMLSKLCKRIEKQADLHDFDNVEGEPSEECSWTTNEEGDDICITDNNISIKVSRRFVTTKPSDL